MGAMSSKTCNRCGVLKSTDEFYPQRVRGGFSPNCRPCESERALEKKINAYGSGVRVAASEAVCADCGSLRPASDFRSNWRYTTGLESRCHECVSDANRLRKFNLTHSQYRDLLARQGGVCAICKKPETDRRAGRIKSFAVDHDHGCCSGNESCGDCVRGLLCGNCNRGLGHLGDDLDTVISAAAYLIENGAMRGAESALLVAGLSLPNEAVM